MSVRLVRFILEKRLYSRINFLVKLPAIGKQVLSVAISGKNEFNRSRLGAQRHFRNGSILIDIILLYLSVGPGILAASCCEIHHIALSLASFISVIGDNLIVIFGILVQFLAVLQRCLIRWADRSPVAVILGKHDRVRNLVTVEVRRSVPGESGDSLHVASVWLEIRWFCRRDIRCRILGYSIISSFLSAFYGQEGL